MFFNQKYLSYQSSFALEKIFFHALIGIDKNLKTNNEAIKFFKEAKQDKKINLFCENG